MARCGEGNTAHNIRAVIRASLRNTRDCFTKRLLRRALDEAKENVMKLTRKQCREAKAKAQAKFKKISALNALGADGRKDKAKLSEDWQRRESRNVSGFYNQKAARAARKGE